MAGKWDSNLKRLVEANPQEFVDWLMEGAVVTRELSIELNREIHIDLLYEAMLNEEIVLVHIEFQRYEDEDMARRLLEYNVYATCKYKFTVYSFVIYLKREGKIVESPLVIPASGRPEVWRFNFTNVKLWEVPTDTFRRMQSVGMLPLLALTRDGGHPDVVNEALISIGQASVDREMKGDLLTIAFHLATLAFKKPEYHDWLIRRFYMYQDIIKDTEIYQLIKQEGREEGIEFEQKEEIDYYRQAILMALQERFPELLAQATERVNTTTDLSALRKLVSGMLAARSTDRVLALLEMLEKNDRH